MMMKGDFQMSLGFIIAVVFAIVLLSLALVWLRGIIGDVTDVTSDLTKQAHDTLAQNFRESANDFAVWPSQYDMRAEKTLIMSAGIENDALDGKDHLFVINIVPASADDRILAAKGCTELTTSCAIYKDMQSWLTFDKSPSLIKINSIGYRSITINPSDSAVKGTYLFNVIACYNDVGSSPPVYSACTSTSSSLWGGSQQPILLNIE